MPSYFDALTMACVADELRGTVLGGRVQAVLLPDSLSAGFEIYAGGRRHYLLASAHAELGRLLLSSVKLRRGVDRQTGFLLLLRKYARGARLSAVDQPPLERILRLEFDHPEWGCSALFVEIMGRHSNLILVDAGRRILDAAKHLGPHLNPRRPVLPGRAYEPPPPQEKLSPLDLTEYRLRQILAAAEPQSQLWRALVDGLRGMSPLLAREIAFRALGQARARVDHVVRLTPILETIAELLAPLETGQWQPTLVMEGGQPAAYAPYPLSHRGDPVPVPSMSLAIERYTAAVAAVDPYAAARRSVGERISAARSRLARQREALHRSLEGREEADTLRQRGEWILAYAHTVTPGQSELVADMGEGEPLHIPLDPDLTAVENAQAYFSRYRKAQRAHRQVPPRLLKVELALRDLEQLEADLELAADRPEIDEVRAALVDAGYVKARRSRIKPAPHGGPLVVTSPDGLTILVGRNSRQNDEVTFRRASSDDWWFHAHGVPGAHVIVRAGTGGDELPADTLRQAAELAAYYSRLRDERWAVVDCTRRRYVRRIPGAAPGLVTYTRQRTIQVALREIGDS